MRWILIFFLTCSMAMAQTKLSSKMFGNLEARNIGPATMSGRITDIDVPVSDTNTIYLGTAGGGLWKSADGGIRFEPIFDDYPQSIGCVTVDQQNQDTIWVGTGEINTRNSVSYGKGLYKSTDAGKTWQHLGFEDSERIAEIRIDPRNSDVVYVAVLGHLWNDHEERGLYKTTDGGKNWERLLYVDDKTGCIDVDLDPQEPDTVYAAMWQVRRKPWFFHSGGPGSGLYKSTDGGKTFKELRNGLPEGELGRIDLDIAASRPNRVYAIVEAEETGLYSSDDLGESWELVSRAFGVQSRPFYLSTVKVDPNDHNRVYNPSLFLSVSLDGGRSFPGLFEGIGNMNVHPDNQALWINPNNSKHLILGTDGGVYVSYNGSDSFRMAGTLPVSMFYHVSVDNQIPYNIYGGLQDNGSWMAPSETPGGVGNRHWNEVGFGDGFYVFADAEDPNFIYWEMQGGVLSRLDLRTQENKNIVPFPGPDMKENRFNWNAPIVPSPTNPKTIYFGSQYLYRSYDKGENWERISPDLTTDDPEKQRYEESGGLTNDATTAENHTTIFTIAESPLNEQVIWVGTDDGNVQVTRDGGRIWTNVTGNLANLPAATWVSSVRPSPHKEGTVYATFDGHRTGDKTPYVYKSEDYGSTWTSLATDSLTGHCHVVQQDSVNPQLLYLGAEDGLYFSFDDGQNWVNFRAGLPAVSIRNLTVQEREGDLLLATHGRGIYVIDDITPLRHLTGEALSAKVALLPSRPGRAAKTRSASNMFGSGQFFAESKPMGIQVTYYLARRHMFGDLEVEIYDDSGRLVKTLPGSNRVGLNRMNWSMRMDPPKASRTSGLNPGSFFGPYVKAGNYTVKLIKGKDTFETAVKLLPALGSSHSEEDRDLQYDTALRLYDLLAEVSFFTDRVSDLHDQCSDRAGKLDKSSLRKKLDKLAEDVKAVKIEIVAEGVNIFVTKERLRDHIVSLYAGLVEYSGRPSSYQLERLSLLEERFATLQERFKPLEEVGGYNKYLKNKGLEPLVLLNREAWLKREEKKNKPDKSDYKLWKRTIAPVYHLMNRMR